MNAVKVGTSWRIKMETGDFDGWYMSESQALKGIAKRIRDRFKNTGETPPTLPTMETVAEDRAAAAGESQAEVLAERLRSSLPSISRTTGDMETHSPLFRESPANPQQNLFQNRY